MFGMHNMEQLCKIRKAKKIIANRVSPLKIKIKSEHDNLKFFEGYSCWGVIRLAEDPSTLSAAIYTSASAVGHDE